MSQNWIKNYSEIATTPARRMALDIVSAGLDAIETAAVVGSAVSLAGNILKIKEAEFNLTDFNRVLLVGFGKAAAKAALALENIMGPKINAGAVIDLEQITAQRFQSFAGTHPKPSSQNIAASQKITELAQGITAKDLVLVIVSGGGSAMLCWPPEECSQSQNLYNAFLKTGGDIEELNTVRKHISQVKGGGLAKLFYPATIIGLIFCDIPGNKYQLVASGPTYPDSSTLAEAQNILKKYNLSGVTLNETPKEKEFFQRVINIPLVSNETALEAMSEKARSLGLTAKILSAEIYDSADETLKKFQAAGGENNAVIGSGEIKLVIAGTGGKGGRNQFLALKATESIQKNQVFVSLASDGLDNSDAAGAIIDQTTPEKSLKADLDIDSCLKNHDTYDLLLAVKDLISTGPTGANVADLMLLLKYNAQ